MRKIYRILIKSVGLIIFVIILYKTKWKELIIIYSKVDIADLLPIYLLIIPKDLIISFRWHTILNKIDINRNYWDNIKLYFSGTLLGTVTPGGLGEFYRIVKLEKEGHSKIKGFFSVLFPRIFDLNLMLLLSISAFYFIPRYADMNTKILNVVTWSGLTVIFFIIFFGVVFRKNFISLIAIILERIFKIKIEREKILDSIKNINFNLFIKIGLLTCVFWAIHFFQIYLLARILNINVSFFSMQLILAIVTLVAALPITVIGLGTREFAMINCLAILGVAREKSLALSLMIYSIFIINGLIAAIFWNMEHK